MRGEYRIIDGSLTAQGGSPPHTWGILKFVYQQRVELRITPTYVGNTSWLLLADDPPEDHPHIRGEYVQPE